MINPYNVKKHCPTLPPIIMVDDLGVPAWLRKLHMPYKAWLPEDTPVLPMTMILPCFIHIFWLVVYLPLWKIWKSNGMILPNIWKHKTCSKPPTRLHNVDQWSRGHSQTCPKPSSSTTRKGQTPLRRSHAAWNSNNYAEWSGVPKIQENPVSPNMFPLNHVDI